MAKSIHVIFEGGGWTEDDAHSVLSQLLTGSPIAYTIARQPYTPVASPIQRDVTGEPKTQPWVTQAAESTIASWRPKNRAEANSEPIKQRCEWALREQWAASEYAPQDWPEVVAVARVFSETFRLGEQKLGRLDGDRLGTLRIVTLLTQYTPDQLDRTIRSLPSLKWVQSRIAENERPRLGWLSDEVVRTAFGALPGEREPASPKVRQLLAEQRAKDEAR